MDTPKKSRTFAWQPLTPRGVAAFSGASLNRLLLVQLFFAILAAATVVWFLLQLWFPTIRQAIRQLPAQGEIRTGTLNWQTASPQRLAEGRFLAVIVDLAHEGHARTPAHVQIEFGRRDFKIFSLLGYWQGSYPGQRVLGFNRPELEPWWDAWSPMLLGLVALSVIGALLVSWAALATLYFLPAWLFGFFINRDLSPKGAWRLCGAALMPGALFLTASLVIYGLGALDMVRLAFLMAIHFVVGWAYIFMATLKLPVHPGVQTQANPFKNAEVDPKQQSTKG